jgi:hypothetical protein
MPYYSMPCVLGRLCKQKEFYSTCIIKNIVPMINLEIYLDTQAMNPTHCSPVQPFMETVGGRKYVFLDFLFHALTPYKYTFYRSMNGDQLTFNTLYP